MILLPRAVRVYFATQPTNLRQSFEGLTNRIRHALGYDPFSGHVLVFLDRRRNQVKLILWTRGIDQTMEADRTSERKSDAQARCN